MELSKPEAGTAAGGVTAGSSPSEVRVKGHAQGHYDYTLKFFGLGSMLT